ncbi:MAG: UvrB/UvrC motif-containing protein [Burkholderiaceae bacterium]|nr:UvrB/UvrC motif-containing protein [Burkholderiaceae bacterium]
MSLTIGRIEREGSIHFGDASISITEEGLGAARNAGGWEGAKAWEREFKRDVFARVVQTLNRLGWTCIIPPDKIETYGMSFARDRRHCQKGELRADLDISGRCIKLEMFQNVNAPDRPDHEGRYQSDKEQHMPYVMRLEMERTRRRIRNYLCNVLSGYIFAESKPELGPDGVTALEYAAHRRQTSGHYVAELDRARISNKEQGFTADGVPLENGSKVFAFDYSGRVICGTAFYDLNGNWMVVTGRYDVKWIWHTEIYATCPGNPRVKRNASQRRKRLEGELAAAIKAMNFERAAVLRDILFPGKPALYVVWNSQHQLYHRACYRGYTSDLSQAGKFTADEVRGWDCAPNEVRPLTEQQAA